MKKPIFLFMLLAVCVTGQSQSTNQMISTIDFVEILNDNRSEAIYYFENNWKVLRKMAMENGHIHSYQLLEVEATQDAPFSLILITTYKDDQQYSVREKNFQELITAKGELKLLNGKKPAEFRKTLFSKETIR
jgi:hypothetical protein